MAAEAWLQCAGASPGRDKDEGAMQALRSLGAVAAGMAQHTSAVQQPAASMEDLHARRQAMVVSAQWRTIG